MKTKLVLLLLGFFSLSNISHAKDTLDLEILNRDFDNFKERFKENLYHENPAFGSCGIITGGYKVNYVTKDRKYTAESCDGIGEVSCPDAFPPPAKDLGSLDRFCDSHDYIRTWTVEKSGQGKFDFKKEWRGSNIVICIQTDKACEKEFKKTQPVKCQVLIPTGEIDCNGNLKPDRLEDDGEELE